jgi:hypothetical protein
MPLRPVIFRLSIAFGPDSQGGMAARGMAARGDP